MCKDCEITPEEHDHPFTGKNETPVTSLLTSQTDDEKITKIADHFGSIMETLGLDMTDDSLQDTPMRVAKMFVKETFSGLHPKNEPRVTSFENHYGYDHMLLERNIRLQSCCEHHMQPIIGVAHVAYIPGERVVGLSKLNRIVEYYSRRPQVQERLTEQIHAKLCEVLKTENVAVVVDAYHYCVKLRGIRDSSPSTMTSKLSGAFKEDPTTRKEFYQGITFNPPQ